jgi:hypothetical protein
MTEPPLTSEGCLLADEVQVGTNNGPGIYAGPPGTEPPASTAEPYTAPWACLGYLSDDGPTIGSSTDSEQLTPWQSATPIKTVITNRQVTMQFVAWQLNPRTLAMYFDTDVPEEGTGGELDFDVRTDQSGHEYAISVDAADGNRVFRISFLRSTLSDAGDMSITRGAVIPLDMTLSALETGGRLAKVQLGPRITGLAMSASTNGTGAGPAVETRSGRRGGGERAHHVPAPPPDVTQP